MPFGDYKRLGEIGSGSFGRAFLVQAGGRQLVMKEIDLSGRDAQSRANAEVEVKVFSSLKHPYIVRYWESFMHDRHLCIVMDYCEGGDLWHYITQCRKKRIQIAVEQVLRWFTQMCLALKYMHERNILHRDIKTQNIFLAKKDCGGLGCVKIADFGIAKVLRGPHAMAQTLVGTPYYLSPEICQKQPYACPSDVWALGCVLYELCALRVPFEAQELPQLVERIVRGSAPRIPSVYPRELAELGTDLLTRESTRRPTAAAILQRPIVQVEIKRMLAENKEGTGGSDDQNVGAVDRESSRHSEDRGRRGARPLGEHNSREPSRQRAPSKPGSRAPSPHKGAALEVLRPSRAPSPARSPNPKAKHR